MRLSLITFIIFSYSAFAFDAKRCEHLVDDCEYYSCLAEAKHCPQNTYPSNFGHRYCLRYEKRTEYFSDNGKLWIQNVKQCLIEKMIFYEEDFSCGQLKFKAFSDHVPCYIDNGFCELSRWDRKQVLKTIYPTLRHLRVLLGGFRLLWACR